jgi:hypothetical protein
MYMKKLISILSISVFALVLFAGVMRADASTSLLGRILLQVEGHGEAWYVLPETAERLYLKDGEVAYAAMSAFGVGITNADLEKIPMGINEQFIVADTDGDGLDDYLEELLGTDINNTDTDGDGYSDGEEVMGGYEPMASGGVMFAIDEDFAESMKGRILLQVERNGEAWYVHPDDGKRYYMRDGSAAYEIMRYLSLGITNVNLEVMEEYDGVLDCRFSAPCFLAATSGGIDAMVLTDIEIDDYSIRTSSLFEVYENAGEYEGFYRSDYVGAYATEESQTAFDEESLQGAMYNDYYGDNSILTKVEMMDGAMQGAFDYCQIGNVDEFSSIVTALNSRTLTLSQVDDFDYVECGAYSEIAQYFNRMLYNRTDCGEDLACFKQSIENNENTTVMITQELSLFGVDTTTTVLLDHDTYKDEEDEDGYFSMFHNRTIEQIVQEEPYYLSTGLAYDCWNYNKDAMVAYVQDIIDGNYSTDSQEFMECGDHYYHE